MSATTAPAGCLATRAQYLGEKTADLAAHGLPVPTSLHISLGGGDATALALIEKAERELTAAGYECFREDTGLFHRLMADLGDGLTYWILHPRRDSEVPA